MGEFEHRAVQPLDLEGLVASLGAQAAVLHVQNRRPQVDLRKAVNPLGF